MEAFKKILNPGTVEISRKPCPVFVVAEYTIKGGRGRLSMTGVEGPRHDGDAWGGCGQIVMHGTGLVEDVGPSWTRAMVARLAAIWGRWHLNDCQAGTPAQMAWIREHEGERDGRDGTGWYHWATAGLSAAGLNPDMSAGGYLFGSAWLYEEVPAEVLAELRAFPDTTITPAWC